MESSSQTRHLITALFALTQALVVGLVTAAWNPTDALAASGDGLSAVFRDGALVVTVPYEEGRPRIRLCRSRGSRPERYGPSPGAPCRFPLVSAGASGPWPFRFRNRCRSRTLPGSG